MPTPYGSKRLPQFSPDGKTIACLVEEGRGNWRQNTHVWTEMVLFPDEPHGLSRIGRTNRRIERLKHMLRWFDRFLK